MIVPKHILAPPVSNSMKLTGRTDPFFAGEGSTIGFSVSPMRPSILACSAVKKQNDGLNVVLGGRKLLSDQKRPFEHLRPKALAKSAIRVIAVQASMIVANFVSDQLNEETKREELVKEGKLTADQADRKNEEWEEREWNMRWQGFSTKVWHGILKYQAIIMTMRFYEHVASRLYDIATVDKLTMDPFKAAIRASNETHNAASVRREMMHTCFWSNIIAFLADFSVHEMIIAYGYYGYYRARKLQRMEDRSDACGDDPLESSDESSTVAFSFLLKSTRLAVSRALGLVGASAGGAIGSTVYAGWGTIIGTQFADGMVAAALDDVHAHSLPGQKF